MRYKTKVALSIKGSRVEKNTEVELSPEEAAPYGDDLTPIDAIPAEPEASPEAPLEEMGLTELKAKAKVLGLSTSGSKAAILERITLHLADRPEEDLEANEEDNA